MKTIIKICVVSRMFVCTFIDTFAQTKEVEIQDDEEVYVNSGIDTSPIEINHIKEKFKEKNRYVNPAKYLSITHQTQKNNYYCGPYAAALLAYYEDYIDNGVIPNSIRAKGSTSAGSTYGNHWVLAYQVREDSVGKGWYKCVDNHGRYNAIIQASWTAGNGWLSI